MKLGRAIGLGLVAQVVLFLTPLIIGFVSLILMGGDADVAIATLDRIPLFDFIVPFVVSIFITMWYFSRSSEITVSWPNALYFVAVLMLIEAAKIITGDLLQSGVISVGTLLQSQTLLAFFVGTSMTAGLISYRRNRYLSS